MNLADDDVPAAQDAVETDTGGSAFRDELVLAAELSALVGIAVVQPVLGPFGESPETFVAAGASPADILWFTAIVTVVPLVVVAALAAATRLFGRGVRSVVQSVLVGVLVVLAVTAFARRLDIADAVKVLIAVGVGIAAGVLYRRWEPWRLFLRFAAPAPLLIALVFLLATPVSSLLSASSSTPVDDAGVAAGEDLAPVLFIVLDELPTLSLMDGAGGVDRELFPNVARLADTSTWYRNHTTVADRTAVAVPSITTGRFVEGLEVPAIEANHPDNLITLLAPTHEVHAVEWVTELCPRSLCPPTDVDIEDDAMALLMAQIDTADPLPTLVGEARTVWWSQVWPFGDGHESDFALAGVSDVGELVEPGLQFLSGIAEPSGSQPVLDYLHIPIPHQPWNLLPSGGGHNGVHPSPGVEMSTWEEGDIGEQLGDQARSRHLLQMQWTDRLLGAIFDRLEDLGRWDDATVVLTADHGVSFRQNQRIRAADPDNQADIYWTPLFIKAPHQHVAEVVDDNVMSIDILPTVADLVGVDLDLDLDGVPLTEKIPQGRLKQARAGYADTLWTGYDEVDLVELDATLFDGILSGAAHAPGGPPELRAWRHGRHGDLLGLTVEELGACSASGPEATLDLAPTWSDYVAGTLDLSVHELPLWHEAVIEADESIDVAVAVDGRVAAWNVSRVREGSTRVGFLLSEPLVSEARSDPELYQIVDDEDGCTLLPLSTE